MRCRPLILRQRGSACRRDLPVLERAHAADPQAADDNAIHYQRHAAFGRNHARQGEVYQPPARYRVFRCLGRALESDRGMRLADRRFDAAELSIVGTLQVQQVAAVIDYSDDDAPVIALCFGFGGRRDPLGIFQR